MVLLLNSVLNITGSILSTTSFLVKPPQVGFYKQNDTQALGIAISNFIHLSAGSKRMGQFDCPRFGRRGGAQFGIF